MVLSLEEFVPSIMLNLQSGNYKFNLDEWKSNASDQPPQGIYEPTE